MSTRGGGAGCAEVAWSPTTRRFLEIYHRWTTKGRPSRGRWPVDPGAGHWFEREILGSERAAGLNLEEVLERWNAFLESMEARRGSLPAVYKNSLKTHLDYEQRRASDARTQEERPRKDSPPPQAAQGTYVYEFSHAEICELLELEGEKCPTREEFRAMCAENGFVDVD